MIQQIVFILIFILVYLMPKKIFVNVYIQALLLASLFIFDKYLSVFFVILYFFKSLEVKIKENFSSEKTVPLKIFQTWHSKDLPPKMKECVEELKKQNPEFKHYLFDDNECREYIKKYFDKEVLETFDALKPGAFKADLWRLCALYREGGIYLDIKFKCQNGFKLIELINSDHLTKDVPNWYGDKIGIYNAFMVFKPNNKYVDLCIKEIIDNVKNRRYNSFPLDVTGPAMMGRLYLENPQIAPPLDIIGKFNNFNVDIYYKDKLILKGYDEYKNERAQYGKTEHYEKMWREKNIYN